MFDALLTFPGAILTLSGLAGIVVYFVIAAVFVRLSGNPKTPADHGKIWEILSPSYCRFLAVRHVDNRTFGSVLLRMAVAGLISIEEKTDGYEIVFLSGDFSDLTKEEQRVAEILSAGTRSGVLISSDRKVFEEAREALQEDLDIRVEKRFYGRNKMIWRFGQVAALLLGSVILYDSAIETESYLFLAVGLAASNFLLVTLGYVFSIGTFSKREKSSASVSTLDQQIHNYTKGMEFAEKAGTGQIGMLVGICAIIAFSIFSFAAFAAAAVIYAIPHLMRHAILRLSAEGKQLYDSLTGYRNKLSDQKQASKLIHGDPNRFERHLPFAIVLDADDSYCDHFAAEFERRKPDGSAEAGYWPSWYRSAPFRREVSKLGNYLGGHFFAALGKR